MRFFWYVVAAFATGAVADNYDSEEDNVTSFAEGNYLDSTLQQRSGHLMEQDDSYKAYIPELTPGTLLCGAFMDTFGNLEERSPEIQELKQEITRNLNSYHKQLYAENEQDVVLEILGLLKRLITALEREYAEAINRQQGDEHENPVESWAEYQVHPTEEILEIHPVSIEEQLPHFHQRLQTEDPADISEEPTEDFNVHQVQDIINMLPTSTEEPAEEYHVHEDQEIINMLPTSTEEPAEEYHVHEDQEIIDTYTEEPAEEIHVHQVQEIADFQPTEQSDQDFSVSQAEDVYSHTVFADEFVPTEYYEEIQTVSEILESADEEMEQYSHVKRHPVQVGSMRGVPGEHFPDYTEIPITSFTCAGKPHIPGFYADMETGCQVFHVCYKHRRESFLCPVGTTFNQPILACDYWYSSNCSLTSHYYDVNGQPPQDQYVLQEPNDKTLTIVDSLLTKVLDKECQEHIDSEPEQVSIAPEHQELSQLLKFLPVKAKVTVYPEFDKKAKIVAVASIGEDKRKQRGAKSRKVHKRPSVAKASAILETVEDTAAKVISDIFKTASSVVKQVETMSPKVVSKPVEPSKIVHKPVETSKIVTKPVKKIVSRPVYRPMTTLNKKFIIKPVKLEKKDKVSPTSPPKQIVKTKRIPHLKSKHFETVLKSEEPGYLISPLTKQTLASGYIRLLKLKV